MVLALVSAWLGCFLLCREAGGRGRIDGDWRLSFVLASAGWGALLAIGTEALSVPYWFTARDVEFWWLGVNAALWCAFFLLRKKRPAGFRPAGLADWRKALAGWPVDAQVMAGAAALFALFLGGIALLTPTTNVDSLTYHLPRVMHWIQNRSVAHYPTNFDAQLQLGPWAEFAVAHLQLLWGGDRLANMVQWCALAGSAIAATFITRQLLAEKTSPRAEVFAAVLVVTMPTAIVESISTQTDLAAGFWMLCFTSLSLAWWRDPQNRILAAGAGAAIGLGVLTKFTVILYAAPVGLALAAGMVCRMRALPPRRIIPGMALSLAICLALAGPHLARNRALYGSAIGSASAHERGGVGHITFSGTLSTLIRNAWLHSNTGVPRLTHAVNIAFHTINGWTGHPAEDPALNLRHARTFEPPDEFFVFDSFAASPWQMALVVAAAACGLATWRKSRLPLLGLGLALAGAAFFSAELRWQIWNSRLHVPLLLFCMPPVAALLISPRCEWFPAVAAAGLFVFAAAVVANNRSRPIFDASWRAQPRELQMLSFQCTDDYEPIREISREVAAAGCRRVGLKIEEAVDCNEYPFWVMLREDGFRGEIHHVLVEGPSGRLPGAPEKPDVIITTLSGQPVGELAEMYPTATKVGKIFTIYWSAEMSRKRALQTRAK